MSRLVDERYLTGGSPELQGFDVETFDDCPGLQRTQGAGQEGESLDSSEQFFLGSLLALCGVLLYLGAVLVSVL